MTEESGPCTRRWSGCSCCAQRQQRAACVAAAAQPSSTQPPAAACAAAGAATVAVGGGRACAAAQRPRLRPACSETARAPRCTPHPLVPRCSPASAAAAAAAQERRQTREASAIEIAAAETVLAATRAREVTHALVPLATVRRRATEFECARASGGASSPLVISSGTATARLRHVQQQRRRRQTARLRQSSPRARPPRRFERPRPVPLSLHRERMLRAAL